MNKIEVFFVVFFPILPIPRFLRIILLPFVFLGSLAWLESGQLTKHGVVVLDGWRVYCFGIWGLIYGVVETFRIFRKKL